jgi:hypothetical protein
VVHSSAGPAQELALQVLQQLLPEAASAEVDGD